MSVTPEQARQLDEIQADLFCIAAEVSAILDRHRPPRDTSDPAYWATVKRQALADWREGRVPIWRRNPDGTQLFFGFENDPEACRQRDEYDAKHRVSEAQIAYEVKRDNRKKARR